MSTRFFTNKEQNTLLDKFRGVFEHNKDISRFDALVGYLRASGWFAIRPHLNDVPKVRILVGIDVDELVEEYSRKGRLFLADPSKCLREFTKALEADIQQAKYSPEVEKGILQFVEDVATKRVEIKAHPTKRLHAKIYLFLPEGFNEHKNGHVITGSSNLTAAGLGVEERAQNYEFNVLLSSYEDVKFASDEFEFLWAEAVTVLPKVVQGVTKNSFLRDDLTPFEIYIKLLIEYFGQSIEYDANSSTDLPEGFMRLAYQMDAVSQGFLLMQKHNGFFLADVVGLGKTIIATLIAKKFFHHNGFPTHLSEVLVVVPPALKDGWQKIFEEFDLKYATIITCGSLHKITNAKKYDLVIIDEAHKFRNDTSDAYDQLQRICKTPSRRRLPDGSLAAKKVILVSATPLNNRPKDIANLLMLFQDSKNSTLEIANLQRFFARQQKDYEKALKLATPAATHAEVVRIYEEIRTKIVGEITIRRTRTDLKIHEDYNKDLIQQGITFPHVGAPTKLLYVLSPELEQLYDHTIAKLDRGLTYNRYQAIGHLVPELKLKYQNADRISGQLARIMRTLLLKRLDSSFHAFTRSLGRFRDATRAMLKMFENGTIYIAPNLNVSEYIIEDREEELIAKIQELQPTDPTIEICTPTHFDKAFLPGLVSDGEILEELHARWSAVSEDPKFDEFLHQLETTLTSPEINHEAATASHPKLVVFSESKETTDYLTKRLAEIGHDRILTIDASTRAHRMPLVRANFDANHPVEEKADDFDIVISTEVLAEGVNLHRANVIVNYDTPWNSTRLMQRIGRVNRIGTTATQIHVFNFFPTAQVDADIDLKKKAIAKLQAFHTALGEDSQIYSTDEEVDTFGLFDSEVKEGKDEALALLMELRKFRKENPERFREIRNLPLRARCGRKDRHRAGSTITFTRNKRRDAFYYLQPDGSCEELSFVEAARVFHAVAAEKPFPLHEDHHTQVNTACETFRDAIQADAVRDRVVDHQLGPNETRALRLLTLFIAHETLSSKDEKILLKLAAAAVRKGVFAKLPRELVKLDKTQKKTPLKPAALLDALLKILHGFPLQKDEEEHETPAVTGLSTAELAPDIILSESFDYPEKGTEI